MPPRKTNLHPRFPQSVMDTIVNCYLQNGSLGLLNGLEYCKEILEQCQKTIAPGKQNLNNKELDSFSKFVIDNKSHQARINKKLKKAVTDAIWYNLQRLRQIDDFESLFDEVCKILFDCGVKHVPSLWAYDIALRIGYSRSASIKNKTLPQKYVYTYQGAHEGAKIWFTNNRVPHIILLQNFSQIIPIFINNHIPYEYVSMHIENMLCHCRGCMKKGFKISIP